MEYEHEKIVLEKKLLSVPREEWQTWIDKSVYIICEKYPDKDTKRVKENITKFALDMNEKKSKSEFKPLEIKELTNILGLTIKRDEENKLVTFLCELSAYTEDSQFNISYNAPSSTGKSFIPTEIDSLFPQEDVREMGYCSPTAFFHDIGETEGQEKGKILVDLSRKILIFLDQPHNQLLERLRPLLSHDKKEITIRITDKNQKQGLRTKNVILRGFPSVVFCTAGLRIDEQESTRFLLLSPEVTQEKLREGIYETIRKETDKKSYKNWLKENPERLLLKERIHAIKLENIQDINIENKELIENKLLASDRKLKPRHQRDVKRLLSIIKTLALLNLWFRDRKDQTIVANEKDIEAGFAIWDKISVSQELNLPPYVYELYKEIILKIWEEKKASGDETSGITREEIQKKHYNIYGRPLDINKLRWEILPILESSGLIHEEADLEDRRKKLIFPSLEEENNSDTQGGVNTKQKAEEEFNNF